MRVTIEPLLMEVPRLGGPYVGVRSVVVTPSTIVIDQQPLPTGGHTYSVVVEEDHPSPVNR